MPVIVGDRERESLGVCDGEVLTLALLDGDTVSVQV